jgi:gliding motility-associated-like protein
MPSILYYYCKMKKSLLLLFCFLGNLSFAQYISRSEPVPYDCPVVCAGAGLILKVPQIENFPNGTVIQALLSNSAGLFTNGTQVLDAVRFSFNQGANWQNGQFVFNGNVNDMFIEYIIPATTLVGNGYTIKMQASNGYVSADLFQCNSNNKITVTDPGILLPSVPQNLEGTDSWNAHIYTWLPTTSAIINTPSLVNAQSFFLSSNYLGHNKYNSLNLDINLSATGGVPGSVNDGTSLPCGTSYTSNFSMRLLRNEVFAPGFYSFSIQGDDGIRLSLDGGVSWILDSFIEQSYPNSFKTTLSDFPNGICLSGVTNMVIEYFQRPADARLTFNVVSLSGGTFTQPDTLNLCVGDNGSFTVGNSITGFTYQWFGSQDNGANFVTIFNSPVYGNVGTNELTLTNVPLSENGNLFYCRINGPCGNPLYTDTVPLIVAPPNLIISGDPQSQNVCSGEDVVFNFPYSGVGIFQWQVDTGNGFEDVQNSTIITGSETGTLTLKTISDLYNEAIFRCVITGGCQGEVITKEAQLIVKPFIMPNAPNVFSPNGDGINDTFFPVTSCNEEIFKLMIYNRWGTLVFESESIDKVWDGTSSGNKLSDGIYFFIADYTSKAGELRKQGSVTLLR